MVEGIVLNLGLLEALGAGIQDHQLLWQVILFHMGVPISVGSCRGSLHEGS